MQYSGNHKPGFARINSLLGGGTNNSACNYVWDESSVVLKNQYFDENVYRQSKLVKLAEKESCLTIQERLEVLNRVFAENEQLMLDISYAGPEEWKKLDHQMEFLIEGAFTLAEHEISLRISRQNIQEARPLADSWMSYQDVNEMINFSNQKRSRRFDNPDLLKFVNRSRH